MIDITKLRPCLKRLCKGHYSHEDVLYVVKVFHNNCKAYIFNKSDKNQVSSGDAHKDIHDRAIDFIGPMLERNIRGQFTILNDYFSKFEDADDDQYLDAVRKFLNIHFRNEYINEVIQSDSLSRSLYRCLTYLVKKNSTWSMDKTVAEGIVINGGKTDCSFATTDDLYCAFQDQSGKKFSKFVESALHTVLLEKKLQVRYHVLLGTLRKITQNEIDRNHHFETEKPENRLTSEMIVQQTVREIDNLILEDYQNKGKLTNPERIAFRQSIKSMMIDMIRESGTRNHADYLSEFLPGNISVDDYRRIYRNQFEYAMREAMNLFSAKMKNIINE